jgi:ATP-dependent exoDNAse (exonuclease V) beta subunit
MNKSNNFLVYRASAGSGKTWVLVKDYIKLCLSSSSPSYYRSVLAVTFTNKAAGEMKERIFQKLQVFAGSERFEKDPHMLEAICEETGLTENVIAERAAACLQHMMHHYSDVSISTIDSFVHTVVRSFARDLNVVPDFKVELDSELAREIAVDDVLSKIGVDKELTSLLIHFSESLIDDEKNWDFRKELSEIAKNLATEESIDHLVQLNKLSMANFTSIKRELDKRIKTYRDLVTNKAQEGVDIIEESGVPYNKFSRSSIPNYLAKTSKGELKLPTDTIVKMVNGEAGWCSKANLAEWGASIESIEPAVSNIIQELIDVISGPKGKEFKLAVKVNNKLYSLAVLNEIDRALDEWKKNNEVLLISDFNRMIHSIITRNPAPFIYERIGQRYRHYLVDEFQDTSVLQWQNFIPLIENSLAHDFQSMIVGDGKQSIYRWRGGQVEQFNSLPRIFRKPEVIFDNAERVFDREFELRSLKNNFRSAPEIVDFNNKLFDGFQTMLGENGSVYEAHGQIPAKNFAGYVSFETFPKEDREVEILAQIGGRIERALADKYQMRDIVILVRTRSDARLVSDGLIEMNNPITGEKFNIITDESLLIKNDRRVDFIANFLLWLEDSSRIQSEVKIMTNLLEIFPDEYDTEEEIKAFIRRDRSIDLEGFLSKHVPDFHLESLRGRACTEVAEWWVTAFADRLVQSDIYIEFLLDHLKSFESSGQNGNNSFLDWWGRNRDKLSVQTQDAADGIRVMTIHKSKGLQFPIVILPLIARNAVLGNIWINHPLEDVQIPSALVAYSAKDKEELGGEFAEEWAKQQLDNVNMLYVALTRPERRLHVLCQETKLDGDGVGLPEIMNRGMAQIFPNDGSWESGKCTVYERKIDPVDHVVTSLTTGDFRDRMKVSFQSRQYWKDSDQEYIRNRGVAIHTLLEAGHSPNAMSEIGEQLVADGLFSRELVDESLAKASEIVSHEKCSHFFASPANSKSEAEIVTSDGNTLRPDRIVEMPDKILVIDYKTGSSQDVHKRQVKKYKEALSSLYELPVEGYLLYTEEVEVEEV